MCQARVFIWRDGQEQEIMRDVILVERTAEGIRLHTFFEKPRTVAGEILAVDLLRHTVQLKPEEET